MNEHVPTLFNSIWQLLLFLLSNGFRHLNFVSAVARRRGYKHFWRLHDLAAE